jgi:hypothetical protein
VTIQLPLTCSGRHRHFGVKRNGAGLNMLSQKAAGDRKDQAINPAKFKTRPTDWEPRRAESINCFGRFIHFLNLSTTVDKPENTQSEPHCNVPLQRRRGAAI